MRIWACLLGCVLLTACAQTPLAPRADFLFHDELFAKTSMRTGAEEVFALSPDMKDYLDTEIARRIPSKGRQWALIEALQMPGQLKLEYDSATTRNVAQAFDARAGNCLSLVIMASAFAKELGLRVQYQSAFVDEAWSRSGNLYLRSGHVNLTLGRRFLDHGTAHDQGSMTIDFLPAHEIRGLRTVSIAEVTVVAMFMNNRAAEALVRGQVDEAYWWVREAVTQDPAFMSAYNTLGVVYMRRGGLAQAERVFKHVLAGEPANTQTLHNLAQVLNQLGRLSEAEEVRRKLAAVEPHPPFQFFQLGRAAMERNDFETAREWFAKEVARDGYNPEFHFWLGLAHFRLGAVKQAQKHLALAMDTSTTRTGRDLYAAKLAWLRSHGAQ